MDIAGGAAGKLEEAALSAINEPGAKRQSMEQRYSVVILTDPRNVVDERLSLNDKNELVVVGSETVVGGHTEDQIIADFLSEEFSVTLQDYRDSLDGIKADVIMVGRNWPLENQDHDEYQTWKRLFIQEHRNVTSTVPLYNSPDGHGDIVGKDHLVRLYQDKADDGILGQHIIPTTFLRQGMASAFPEYEHYVIKPIDGLSSLGSSVATRSNFLLLSEDPGEDFSSPEPKFIVQPLLEIEKEISFYFVDGELQYCLDFPPKIPEWRPPLPYQPSSEERVVADGFIDWNNMSRGITRLDFARTSDGRFYLLEIEDFNPYLSLPDIPEELKNKHLAALSASLKKVLEE